MPPSADTNAEVRAPEAIAVPAATPDASLRTCILFPAALLRDLSAFARASGLRGRSDVIRLACITLLKQEGFLSDHSR